MLTWRFYYKDGSTYSNLDGPAERAPKSGARGVVVLDPVVGWQVLYGTSGSDFFCYNPAWDIPHWRNMNSWGFQKYMRDPEPPVKVVVFGEWEGNVSFHELERQISIELNDRQFYPWDKGPPE